MTLSTSPQPTEDSVKELETRLERSEAERERLESLTADLAAACDDKNVARLEGRIASLVAEVQSLRHGTPNAAPTLKQSADPAPEPSTEPPTDRIEELESELAIANAQVDRSRGALLQVKNQVGRLQGIIEGHQAAIRSLHEAHAIELTRQADQHQLAIGSLSQTQGAIIEKLSGEQLGFIARLRQAYESRIRMLEGLVQRAGPHPVIEPFVERVTQRVVAETVTTTRRGAQPVDGSMSREIVQATRAEPIAVADSVMHPEGIIAQHRQGHLRPIEGRGEQAAEFG